MRSLIAAPAVVLSLALAPTAVATDYQHHKSGKHHKYEKHHKYGKKDTGLVGYALSKHKRLTVFDADHPLRSAVVGKIRGLDKGEKLVGIDFRPRTNELWAVGSDSNLYTIDTDTARATKKSTLNAAGATVALEGDSFGVDFNPVVDRLRIVSDAEQNLRVNVDTGATTIDGDLNQAGRDPNVVGAAYTNNDNDELVVAPAMPTPGTTATTLYDIDSALDALLTQAPPNDGVLNTVGSLGVNTNDRVGFDIYSDVDGGRAVSNTAYASLSRGGYSALFTVDLATGDADRVGFFRRGVKDIAFPQDQR